MTDRALGYLEIKTKEEKAEICNRYIVGFNNARPLVIRENDEEITMSNASGTMMNPLNIPNMFAAYTNVAEQYVKEVHAFAHEFREKTGKSVLRAFYEAMRIVHTSGDCKNAVNSIQKDCGLSEDAALELCYFAVSVWNVFLNEVVATQG